MAKKIAKPAPKRPAPRPLPQRRPQPIDMVRDPGFGSAMAQQNFLNSLAELRAKADAERGGILSKQGPQAGLDSYGFTKRDPRSPDTQYGGPVKELKLPPQGPQVGGGNQDIIDFRKRIYDDLMARQGQPFSPIAEIGDRSKKKLDPIAEIGGDFRPPQGQQDYYDVYRGDQEKKRQMARDALSRYNPNAPSLMPIRTPGSDALNQDLANRGMGGGIPSPIPQGQQQQMQSYQNFLNQGMNNMASVNQGAAESFANTQPGMPTTGSSQQFTANPAMPVAGMGAQKSRPTPRKFSTVSNSPARFA